MVQPKGQPRRLVDFAHLGAEELGSIYESLLELVPRLDPTTHTFTLETLAGNDRKTSGSYYTPTDLVDLVLDTALDPVLDDAEKGASTAEEAEAALLAVRVCDPAVGSAHFLVSAARRIATRLATVRTGEVDPTPTAYSDALHDVVARCVYGVDINPMAADLAKVSLWLTAMSPGRPLSFLDHHIKVGNALLGTTPALLHAGIPDAAYAALTGDDKQVAASWRKRNAAERAGQGDLFDDAGVDVDLTGLRKATVELGDRAAAATTVDEVAWAAQRYADLQADPDTVRARRVADAWCAAFLGPKTADARADHPAHPRPRSRMAAPQTRPGRRRRGRPRHRLFHWHLEFPDIFTVPEDGPGSGPYGWAGGFLGTAGNPPWETLQMSEKEFFATREPVDRRRRRTPQREKASSQRWRPRTQHCSLSSTSSPDAERGREFRSSAAAAASPFAVPATINTYSVFAEHFRADTGPERPQRDHHPHRARHRRRPPPPSSPTPLPPSGWRRSTTSRTRRRSSANPPPPLLPPIDVIAARHRLFHWHLEFPDVFTVPDDGPAADPTAGPAASSGPSRQPAVGDAANCSEKEFFATRDPPIAEAKNAAARKKRSSPQLGETEPNAVRASSSPSSPRGRGGELSSSVAAAATRSAAAGKINTYSVFAEHFRSRSSPERAQLGILTPTGLATDATTAAVLRRHGRGRAPCRLVRLRERGEDLRRACTTLPLRASPSMTGGERVAEVRLGFVHRGMSPTWPPRRFTLAPDEVLLLNPNTGTLPVFRTRATPRSRSACYRRHPVLIRDGGRNPWGCVQPGPLQHGQRQRPLPHRRGP